MNRNEFANQLTPQGPSIVQTSPHRILILGGGFAGVYTAMNLQKKLQREERKEVQIILVNRENYVVFQPLLPEVISGTIETLHCISPIRRLASECELFTRDVESIDLVAKKVRLAPGHLPKPLELEYDDLVIGLGTRLNFAMVPGLEEHAIPFKYLGDALRLRHEAVRALELADVERDPVEKKKLLTFVVAGGGFSGVECLAELHDFLTKAARSYQHIERDEIRCVLVQSAERILPELAPRLAEYAHKILQKRGIEILTQTRCQAVSANGVIIANKATGEQQLIPSSTVVTTVPAEPHPLIQSLPCPLDRGRIQVTEYMNVPGFPGVWAVGDCAAVPQRDGITSPPTAQHAVRQANICAKNILATMRGTKMHPFLFTGLGKLASLGRFSAVAEVGGIHFRGLIAWIFWRSVYLAKFPGFSGKFRVAMDWLLDFILPRDITQVRVSQPEAVRSEHFHAGEMIFDRGDFGDRLYIIRKGEVNVHLDGNQVVTLSQGEVFGEMSLLSDLPRNARICAKTPVDVVTVSRPAFQQLVSHLPGVRPAIEAILRSHGIHDLSEVGTEFQPTSSKVNS